MYLERSDRDFSVVDYIERKVLVNCANVKSLKETESMFQSLVQTLFDNFTVISIFSPPRGPFFPYWVSTSGARGGKEGKSLNTVSVSAVRTLNVNIFVDLISPLNSVC